MSTKLPSMATHNIGISCDINHNNQVTLKGKVRGPTSIPKVNYWLTDGVLHWLKKHCKYHYQHYAHVFKEHEITGRVLLLLTDQKLALMGIENVTDREEILLQILRLKLTNDERELKELEKIAAASTKQ